MKLENIFLIPIPVEDAWHVLLDVERIGPCMPGATVESVEGDVVVGRVKVKLGPIGLTYRGKLRFIEKDGEAFRVVMSASAKEERGNGTAKATITAHLQPKGRQTEVRVETDLSVTGKPGQFGRGVLEDVSGILIQQFATSLAAELEDRALGNDEPKTSANTHEQPHTTRTLSTQATPRARPAEAIDLLGVARSSLIQRFSTTTSISLSILTSAVVGWLIGRRTRRER